MRIIFCVRNYLPMANATGVCISKIADELILQGYEVTVIAEKNDIDQGDEQIINGVRVCRFLSQETGKRLNLISKYKTSGRSLDRLLYHVYRMKLYIKALLSKTAVNQAFAMCFRQKFEELNIQEEDILVPVSAPFESLCAAVAFKEEKKLAFKIVPILYDLFKDCVYTNRGRIFKHLKYENNKKIEQQVLSKCDGILALSVWQQPLSVLELRGVQVSFVEIPLVYANAKNEKEVTVEENSLVFCGNFDNRIRKTDYLVSALESILTRDPELKMHFYGNADQFSNIQELKESFSQQIFLHGYVASERMDEIQAGAQFLVNVGNANNAQIPSKIYRYMSLRKPILCFTERADDLALKVMDKYPLLLAIVKNRTDDIDSVMKEMAQLKEKCLDYSTVEQLFQTATPAYTANCILSHASTNGVNHGD